MPQYSFRYVSGDGKVHKTKSFFPDFESLEEHITREQGTLLEFQEEKEEKQGSFSKKTIIEFTETIGLLVNSGHSLAHALELGSELASSKQGQNLSSRLLNDIKKGSSFSKALEDMGSSFPSVYKGLVSVGERSGSLKSILKELTSFLKSNKSFWSKIISATIYPLLLLFSLTIVMGFFVFFFLPQFVEGISATNPNAAKDMAAAADTLIIGTIVMLSLFVSIALFILAYKIAKNNGMSVAQGFERIILKIPLINRLTVLREMVTYHFALQTLSSGGVPLEESLEISKSSLSLMLFREAIENVRQDILGGRSLSQSYDSQNVFPKEMVKWARIGEETGDVSAIFNQLKEYYQEEMDVKTQRISDLAFPILIIFVGLILLGIVVNVILPVLTSMQTGY